MLRRLSVGILCLLLLVALCGCSTDTGRDAHLRLPIDTEPTQLDPQMAEDSASVGVLSTLFEGLTALDGNGNVVPAAAEMAVSEDGLIYTFTLLESYWSTQAKTAWSEPTRVTAADFAFALRRLGDPAMGSPHAALLTNVRDITTEGDDRLVITLATPDADFARKLASSACYPCNEQFFRSTNGRYGLNKEYLLCNGPLYLQAWNRGESLLCNRNNRYHDAGTVCPESVRFVVADRDAVMEEIAEGTLHIARIAASDIAAAEAAGYTVSGIEDTCMMLHINTDVPLLAVPACREALRGSVEWTAVAAQMEGMIPATGYLPGGCELAQGIPYRTRTNPFYFAVIDNAAEVWQSGVAEITGDLSLNLLCDEDETTVALAKLLIQSWQKHLGIYCSLETASAAAVHRRIESGNYQLGFTTEIIPYRSAFKVFETLRGQVSADYDAALSAAEVSISEGADLRETLEELESCLWQQCVTLPVGFITRYTATAPGVEGLLLPPFEGDGTGRLFDFRGCLVFEE